MPGLLFVFFFFFTSQFIHFLVFSLYNGWKDGFNDQRTNQQLDGIVVMYPVLKKKLESEKEVTVLKNPKSS